jgi:hypothetical protein
MTTSINAKGPSARQWAIGIALGIFTWGAWRAWGWGGVALASGAVVLWVLLGFTRTMGVLQRAAKRPKGWCASAVMLQSVLQPGMSLLDIVGRAGALGHEVRALDATQTEVWRWTDDGGAWVACTLVAGKLTTHEFGRPPTDDAAA